MLFFIYALITAGVMTQAYSEVEYDDPKLETWVFMLLVMIIWPAVIAHEVCDRFMKDQ
jgi:hypothetical protein